VSHHETRSIRKLIDSLFFHEPEDQGNLLAAASESAESSEVC
jgi:hypothetical protein